MEKEQKPTLVYEVREGLYINLTSACTAACWFCPREENPSLKGYTLSLTRDPNAQEVLSAIKEPTKYKEIVFCGFGEPTLRLKELVEVARKLKEKGVYIRLNTNGHGNLIHGRSIVPDLAGLIDEVSVSLNATSEEEYLQAVKPKFGPGTFVKVCEFILETKAVLPKVTVTAVAFPGFDSKKFKKFVAEKLGVDCRIRAHDQLGD
jgi:TatD DNase family protein